MRCLFHIKGSFGHQCQILHSIVDTGVDITPLIHFGNEFLSFSPSEKLHLLPARA